MTEALLEHFRQSAEAAEFKHPLEGPELLAELAAEYLDVTLVSLKSRDLEELLFDYVHHIASGDASHARNIVDTIRAFYTWLGREHPVALSHLAQPHELIDLLQGDAVRELGQLMDDPANPGPLQAMMMKAVAQGVDMTSNDAVAAFVRSQMQAGSEFGSVGMYQDEFRGSGDPPPSALTPEQQRTSQKKRKKNRKASRKSRKRNR